MFKIMSTAEQRPFEHVATLPTRRRNDFESDGFVAPGEDTAPIHQSQKEILILSTSSKLRSEWWLDSTQDFPTKEHVSSASLPPSENGSGSMFWPITKPSLDNPRRRLRFKVRLDGTKHASNPGFIASLPELS